VRADEDARGGARPHGDADRGVRVYRSLTSSIRDHGRALLANPVYAPAFKYVDDDTRFVKKIARFYATDSKYASKVLAIMKKFKLRQYDVKGDAPSPLRRLRLAAAARSAVVVYAASARRRAIACVSRRGRGRVGP